VRVLEGLARELATSGVTIVWVTHDLAQADRLADYEVVLVDGRVADAHAAEHFRRCESSDHRHDDGDQGA
jgi:ABC-type phosphate transport system ATPase subunit